MARKNKGARATSNVSVGLLEENTVIAPSFGQGTVREFLITSPPKSSSSSSSDQSNSLLELRKIGVIDYVFVLLLLLGSLYVRMANLNIPDSVVFDEVHFGGFARKYILGKFFMDVHPPLAKMLFAAIAKMGGFAGHFEFKTIGDTFPNSTPYVLMRQLPAILGTGTVLLAYFTLKLSGVRSIIAFLTAFLLLIENANVTISRYILLDSPLLFFIASAIYIFKKFEIQQPFSIGYFKTLLGTGIALGLALSSKWVGLFTVAWVGLLCAYHCWLLIGDLSVSPRKVIKQFWWRSSILLGVPAILYFLFFVIHFNILSNEGDGSSFMSSAFRSTLAGNTIPRDITAQVGLGSNITLKHLNTNGGYLHSHDHYYPAGSKQQQITLYPHLDINNNWIVEAYNQSMHPTDTFVPLVDGIKIRLRHLVTGRRLHSHDEKPPVSERDWQKEASCYGFDGFEGDPNDDFIVELVSSKSKNSTSKEIRAIESIFRLRHAMTGNYLFSTEVKLPEWGFSQQEVTTASQGKRYLTEWYIETNSNPFIKPEDAEIINYPVLSLWDKFVESHKVMWKINKGLTEHHTWQSSPQDWPLLMRGINYWVKDNKQIYLLGNAVIWWSVSISIVIFAINFVVTVFRWKFGADITNNKDVFNFNYQVFSYLLGWGLHYFPFYIMGRQLFLHHYIPAYYFGILALGHFFELFVAYVGSKSKHAQKVAFLMLVVFVALSTVFYVQLSPLIYGTPWTKSQCVSSKIIDGWDYDCNNFHETLIEYNNKPTGTQILPPQQTELDAIPVVNLGEPNEAEETIGNIVEEHVAHEEIHQSPIEEEHEESSQHEQLVPPFEEEETASHENPEHNEHAAQQVIQNEIPIEAVSDDHVDVPQQEEQAQQVYHQEEQVQQVYQQEEQVEQIHHQEQEAAPVEEVYHQKQEVAQPEEGSQPVNDIPPQQVVNDPQ